METVIARYEPDKEDRPRCSDCGAFIDKGNAVLEYMCRYCYCIEIDVEIRSLIDEFVNITGLTKSEFIKSGMPTALLKLNRMGREK